jgi:predicted NBD/HSP70 family sugar kinase
VSLHIAVDLGGTNCRVAGYESTDTTDWVDCKSFEVKKVHKEAAAGCLERAFEKDLENLFELINQIDTEPASISIAVAGKVNRDRSLIIGAGNLVHWVGQSFVSGLRVGFNGCPVVLGNDAEAAAMADALYGHGRDKNFLEMIWGSGVGGCGLYWRSGSGLRSQDGARAHPGQEHQGCGSVPTQVCGCGRFYCLESYCGGDNIGLRHGGIKNVTVEEWERYGRAIAQGAGDVLMLHPELECVIFSGGVICEQRWLLPLIEDELTRQNMFEPPEVAPLEVRRFRRHARSTGSWRPTARRQRSPGLGVGLCERRSAHPIWVVRPPLAAINSRI